MSLETDETMTMTMDPENKEGFPEEEPVDPYVQSIASQARLSVEQTVIALERLKAQGIEQNGVEETSDAVRTMHLLHHDGWTKSVAMHAGLPEDQVRSVGYWRIRAVSRKLPTENLQELGKIFRAEHQHVECHHTDDESVWKSTKPFVPDLDD